MHKQNSRVLRSILACVLALTIVVPAAAAAVRNYKTLTVESGLSLYLDGNQVAPGADLFTADGTSYVPARALTEAMGAQVGYDDESYSVYVDTLPVDGKAAEYLEVYFGVTASTSFNDALKAIFGENAATAAGNTVADAVTAAVKNCGLKELALAYTAGDAQTATVGVRGIPTQDLPYAAAALSASLASGSWNFGAQLDNGTAAQLLMNAANIAGKGRNYLGNVSDPDIARKLMSAWATFGNFDDPVLSQLGADLVIAEASTGYNLKYDGYNANFLPKYTIQYGHSDITHAVQLVALLNAKGIDAKVALEPKTSIYEYMVEWGDPTKVTATSTYELRPIEGTERWLCYATEYDMKLEFDSVEDKNALDAIVSQYAKKWLDKLDENGKPTENLLYGAWFQPLYTSTVPMEDTENFTRIQDNVVHNGPYTIHPFSTYQGNDAIKAVMAEKAPDLSVDVVELYVNNAFYRYLTGTGED